MTASDRASGSLDFKEAMYARVCDMSWRPAYRAVVDKLVAKHGGRYIARTTNPWEVLEGAAPDITNITMIEFPSIEHARAWYNDPEYAPMKRRRQAGSRLNLLLVEGSA
jgi:uncharacterized protein (DUF1330 family)